MGAPLQATLTALTSIRRQTGDARLLVFDGERAECHPIAPGASIIVGRTDDVDLPVRHPSVSRRHARLTFDEGELRLTDLGSHNGTFVNGRRLEPERPTTLFAGDALGMGEAVMVVMLRQPPSARASIRDARGTRGAVAHELERALRHGRPLALVAVVTGAAADPDVLERVLGEVLRGTEIAGCDDDGTLLVLLPELDGDAAERTARDLVGALALVAEEARAGVAACPRDGCDADHLLGAAREAALAAPAGRVERADAQGDVLQVADRSVVVADPAMRRLFSLVRRLAASPIAVLVHGETGVGKEHVAFAVHAWSARSAGPFVAVNCAALPDTLIESELFGYGRGAFSGAIAGKAGLFEAANGGTIFLDEVGELSAAAQAKLLRVLETRRLLRVGEVHERPIDVRVVAATHRDLVAEANAGRFRRDLLFRLNTAVVDIPPLRHRPRELPILARWLLAAACRQVGRAPLALSEAALRALAGHEWPGNVRELKNAMEFVAAACPVGTVEPWHLPAPLADADADPAPAPAALPVPAVAEVAVPTTFRPLADEVQELEARRIREALAATGGIQVHAARLLSMPRRTFLEKMRRYGLR